MSVVALGAFCDLVPPEEYGGSPGGLSFSVGEFAVLDDGRRLTLHEERGWTQWVRQAVPASQAPPADWGEPPDPWLYTTRDDLVQNTLNVVLPDDDDDPDDHPYEWLADLLREHGIHVAADDLRALPYTVELSRRLEDRISQV